MNRIICDICGSEYPETADRCPICSYPRQGTEKLVAAGAADAAVAKVKGGRFSTKNVKKRRKQQQKTAAAAAAAEEVRERDPNRPLWITIIILLIAILLVSLYIGVRFLRGRDMFLGAMTTTEATTQPTQTTVPPTVPCANIYMDDAVIALDEAGQTYQLELRLLPENTTDKVCYSSSDLTVAQVSEDGLITAVGSGQADIHIVCGDVGRVCTVVCWFASETTVPPETTVPVETTAPTEPPKATEAPKATKPTEATEPAELTLDVTDASCFTQNEVFTLSVKLGSKSIGRSKVTWTSSDPNVAAVENGKVTAVGKGTATITAEYQGKKATCVVRCRFADTSWKASAADVTLGIGESFRLSVTNNSGETADAIWTMDLEGVVSVEGRTVTGRAPGTVTLTTTVDGVTMQCIVRVK